jgi:hypothetical protein
MPDAMAMIFLSSFWTESRQFERNQRRATTAKTDLERRAPED